MIQNLFNIDNAFQMWAPPTPPQDDNDVYIDKTMFFLYEPSVMPETQLPPVYVRKEHKRPKVETVTSIYQPKFYF